MEPLYVDVVRGGLLQTAPELAASLLPARQSQQLPPPTTRQGEQPQQPEQQQQQQQQQQQRSVGEAEALLGEFLTRVPKLEYGLHLVGATQAACEYEGLAVSRHNLNQH